MLPFSYNLSLSLIIVHLASISLVLEELGATLLLQPLPLVIKEELWTNCGVQDFVWIFHAIVR
jgi:hypothetical protein